jgi:2-hydroxy-6-oxonona-2,4-dienedioate hydrolase
MRQDNRRAGEPKTSWTIVNGLPVHARVSEGPSPEGRPAVVLVHGLIVSSRYMVSTLKQLAPHYRVYAPDLPGFGKSANPPRILDISGLSDSLATWMGAVGLKSAVLVGNSFGCQIIADLAARHPEPVKRVVLQSPTFDPRGRTVLRQAARFLLNVPREPFSLNLIMLLDTLDAGFWRGWRTLRYALEDRIEDKLPLVRAPALVVRGARDPIVPQPWVEEVARLLPEGRLAIVSGAAHVANYDAPLEFARLIRTFLYDDG